MKVTRRRILFHQPPFWRRQSNLYRLFLLAIFSLFGIWLIANLTKGAIRNPFEPTPTSTRTAGSYAQEGQTFFNIGNLNAAIASYQQATQVNPNDAEVWTELARIQAYSSRLLNDDTQRLARLTEAMQSADQAVALAPEDSNVRAIRAFVLDWNADSSLDVLRTGKPYANDLIFEAEQEAVRAISMDKNNYLALAFYAEILVDQQKWTQAEPIIQQALQLGPQIMDIHRVYGQYLESVGNYNQAIEEYQQALTINPNLTFLYISIGVNYRKLASGNVPNAQQIELYNLALENFAKAASINTQLGIKDPLPYLGIAKTYTQQGEFFAAALNAQKAIAIDPTNADLYGQLGHVYKSGRNFETALIALKCAVRGCTPPESCQARNGCPTGDNGVAVTGLPLSSSSAPYYLDYGSVLAAFSPRFPSYCTEAVDVLTQLINAFGNEPDTVSNARDGLSICASVAASQAQTPTSIPTPTLLPTPRP